MTNELNQRSVSETAIIDKISEEFGIDIPAFDERFYIAIDSTQFSFFEKAILLRERGRHNQVQNYKLIKNELDNLIHLNNSLNISLNPFLFTFCSQYTYNIVQINTPPRISIEFGN